LALAGDARVLVCGNGGSASSALHFVAELVNRLRAERVALPAVALCADVATLTAIANDTGFERVFARQVDALGRAGDVLVALSTSGRSGNVIAAAHSARAKGCAVVALTGRDGGELAALADVLVAVPSGSVARVQEVHALCLHALARALEDRLVAPGTP
jgi:D-sedoheptulose 7-phosphate isomerase